jgi:transcriptional regulator EpsA
MIDFAAQFVERNGAVGVSEALEALELESLVLNLNASLRVHTRSQFFSWTQGLLQGLIRHELLVCALFNGKRPSPRVDSFSMAASDPSTISELFLRDASLVTNLIKAWEERRYRPLICDAAHNGIFARCAFASELQRRGATRIMAQGTHDADGETSSLFVFAYAPESGGPRHAYLAQMAVPFLHAAWLRTQIDERTKGNDIPKSTGVSNVTLREKEILKWIYLGKSNGEIGSILSISPLTVKNHVQKVLRKLNVVNRAQAIGKALDLRILKT